MNKKMLHILLLILMSGVSSDAQAMAGRFRATAARCAQMLREAAYTFAPTIPLTGVVVAGTVYQQYEKHIPLVQDSLDRQYNLNKDRQGPVFDSVKKICSQHGIENVAVALELMEGIGLSCARNRDTFIFYMTPQAFEAWHNGLKGMQVAMPIEQLKAASIHEIGHYKEDDSKTKLFLNLALLHNDTKSNGAAAFALGAGLTAAKTLGTVLPAKAKAIFLGSFLFGLGAFEVGKEVMNFTPLCDAVSRSMEHRADRYVAQTAAKENNPQLLDDFVGYFQSSQKLGVVEGPSHPLTSERIAIAQKAAQELRERLS